MPFLSLQITNFTNILECTVYCILIIILYLTQITANVTNFCYCTALCLVIYSSFHITIAQCTAVLATTFLSNRTWCHGYYIFVKQNLMSWLLYFCQKELVVMVTSCLSERTCCHGYYIFVRKNLCNMHYTWVRT